MHKQKHQIDNNDPVRFARTAHPSLTLVKPRLQILAWWMSTIAHIGAQCRPIIKPSTAYEGDTAIGIAIIPIRSVSPLKRGPTDIAIFPSRDWSM